MSNNNEPVFPISDCSKTQCHGLSTRELFAAIAMQGMLANKAVFDGTQNVGEWIAKHSVYVAESLIEELNK